MKRKFQCLPKEERTGFIKVKIYCDGGGDNWDQTDFYGSFAVYRKGECKRLQRFFIPQANTSNEAEYCALLEALKYIVRIESGNPEKKIFWTIHTDSKLIQNQVLGSWRLKAENLLPYRNACQKYLENRNNIDIVWVPREVNVEILGH